MKKFLLTIAVVALLSGSVSAQVFSVWGEEARQTCDYFTEAPYTNFEVWLFLDPGAEGAAAAEYMFTFPAGVISTQETKSPNINLNMGSSYNAGNSVNFEACETGITWLYHWACLNTAVDPGYFTVVPHDQYGTLIITTCEEGYPIVDASVHNYFGFNASCQVGTEESSWGAIKSMMNN